jgi:FkbM family methyltransferase
MNAIKLWLARQANRLLRHCGAALVSYPSPANRRRRVLMERYGVTVVVDIGANTGQYGQRLREHGYRNPIVSYEPLPDAYQLLLGRCARDALWQANNVAVSNTTDPVVLHIASNSESSSVLPMLPRHWKAAQNSRTIGEVLVPSTTLDIILQALDAATIMLKIDTQGYEWQVLEGGKAHLARVALIEIELSIVPLYSNQVLFRQMDSFLTAAGFALVSMEEGFFDRVSGELLQVDAIYANLALAADDRAEILGSAIGSSAWPRAQVLDPIPDEQRQ